MTAANEEWRPIPQFEGYYSVSESGAIRSDRRGQNLKPSLDKNGYARYVLSVDAVKTSIASHRAVALAFLGKPPPNKPLVLHNDDDPANNHYSNLRWGTVRENSLDAVSNGRNVGANATSCIQGHPKPPYEGVHRQCGECAAIRNKERRSRGLPVGDSRHGTLNGYNGYGCRCPECKNAWLDYSEDRKARRRGLSD